MSRLLHIVSFDIPYPPNYGGIIDVFYKIKCLSALNITIYLHVFEYNRERPKELEKYCEKIFYYKRNSFLTSIVSTLPFRVKSRASKHLLANLKSIAAPILFEGLHTTFPLTKADFNNRLILVRTHNIEHLYFKGLSSSEQRLDKKLFFKLEAFKFFTYEKILKKVTHLVTISPSEQVYFNTKFGEMSKYVPVFHQNTKIAHLSNRGEYALYHGDLRVSDNVKSALFLITVFKDINYPLLIASSFKNERILKKIDANKQLSFIEIKNEKHLLQLLQKAHINVLPTFQKTGIKLKLINTLFNSRFCVVTNEMVEDTGLEDLCSIGTTKGEFKAKILELIDTDYTIEEAEKREKILESFDVKESAKKIINLLY